MSRSASPGDGLLRFITTSLVIGGIGYCGGWVYANVFGVNQQLLQKQQQLAEAHSQLEEVQQRSANQAMMIDQMGTDLAAQREEIARLDTSLQLVKVNHRVAVVDVLRQVEHPQTGLVSTELRFQEVDGQGQPLAEPRVFHVEGDLVYFDYLVVKFADELVEQAAVGQGNSLCLFRRLFGEFQQPHEGYTLDNMGTRPAAYGGGTMNEFEQRIWNNFWTIANQPQVAAGMGIRAAHGEAVSMQLHQGARYQILLRASDGLTIHRVGEAPSDQPTT